MLMKYKARKTAFLTDDNFATVIFEIQDYQVKIDLPVPQKADFRLSPTGNSRKPDAIEKAFLKAIDTRWKVLALVIKAKLQAIEHGVTSIENEFLAQIVLSENRTIRDTVASQLTESRTNRSLRAR